MAVFPTAEDTEKYFGSIGLNLGKLERNWDNLIDYCEEYAGLQANKFLFNVCISFCEALDDLREDLNYSDYTIENYMVFHNKLIDLQEIFMFLISMRCFSGCAYEDFEEINEK